MCWGEEGFDGVSLATPLRNQSCGLHSLTCYTTLHKGRSSLSHLLSPFPNTALAARSLIGDRSESLVFKLAKGDERDTIRT